MSYRLIGISGKFGAGKDTVAEMIMSRTNLSPAVEVEWKVLRFADRLKEMVALLTHTSREANYSREGKQLIPEAFAPLSLGALQQKLGKGHRRFAPCAPLNPLLLGMALREAIDENVWVMALDAQFIEARKHHHVIVPDVRFPNELEYIKNRGGIVVRVNRDQRPADNRDAQHISETALDDAEFDVVLENNGTLEDLAKQVENFLKKINLRKEIFS